MKLYVVTLFQVGGDLMLLGAFSGMPQSITAGENTIRDLTDREPIMLDWDHEGIRDRIFYDGFTLSIVETTLDQVVMI